MIAAMKTHHPLRWLAVVAITLFAWAAAPSAAHACDNGRSIGAGSGTNAFYLWSCSTAFGPGRAYAEFYSGRTSTRASQCQIWIRPEYHNRAQFFDCTPDLRRGLWHTFWYSDYTGARAQSCYRLKYGSGPWTRSYCVWSG
jgi:hypothetical protein